MEPLFITRVYVGASTLVLKKSNMTYSKIMYKYIGKNTTKDSTDKIFKMKKLNKN